jgi:hypothetical protein
MNVISTALTQGLLVAALCAIGAVASADTQFELSAGTEYTRLKFADGTTSSIWYAPFSARIDIGNWSIHATIPYESISAPQNLIVFLNDDPTGAGASNPGSTPTSAALRRTVSGIGDSSLAVTYSFDEIGGSPLYVDLGARVRVPTGNAHAGTGIGATDYGLHSEWGVELTRWGAALSGGRRYLGTVDGLDRVNGWQAGADVWLNLGPHALVGIYYDWRDASERELNNPRDAGIYLSYRLSRRWKVRVDASRALDLSDPNTTTALTVYWRFSERRAHH